MPLFELLGINYTHTMRVWVAYPPLVQHITNEGACICRESSIDHVSGAREA